MRTLYIDCAMGAAGDMLTAALLELCEDREAALAMLRNLAVPGVEYTPEPSVKCGITGTHMTVHVHGHEEDEHLHEHHHHHSSLHDIGHIVEDLHTTEDVKRDIQAVYQSIAEAESRVHGVPVTEIHFHEVGTMDAVADVAAVCALMRHLKIEKVLASPVHVGSGQVHCAHGILPVPAPATALLLRGIPMYGGTIRGELCTPTGAALLRHFVSAFGEMPTMQVEKIGYGMGKKDFEAANCVRAFLGETADDTDSVTELVCNIDDMTAEDLGFAVEQLLESGALDVFTIAAGMKKNRPGTVLHVLCKSQEKEEMAKRIFRYTTTIGIREQTQSRYVLLRSVEIQSTPYGDVRHKVSRGYGVKRDKIEYEDLAAIARQSGKTPQALRAEIQGKEE